MTTGVTGVTIFSTLAAPAVRFRVLSLEAISFMSSDIALTVKVTFEVLPVNGAETDCELPGFNTMVVE
jgi:hypothetical protein